MLSRVERLRLRLKASDAELAAWREWARAQLGTSVDDDQARNVIGYVLWMRRARIRSGCNQYAPDMRYDVRSMITPDEAGNRLAGDRRSEPLREADMVRGWDERGSR